MKIDVLDVLFLIMSVNVVNSVEDNVNANDAKITQEEIYRKLYARRRAEHLEAIKGFQQFRAYEKQYSMINVVAKNLFAKLSTQRTRLENLGYLPGVSTFPTEGTTLDAISSVLENVALFGELILRFPDITNTLFKSNKDWEVLFQWGLHFLNESQALVDGSTLKLINLVNQERNYTTRDPDYYNPYRIIVKHRREREEDENKNSTKVKRKKFIKGPMISKIEL